MMDAAAETPVPGPGVAGEAGTDSPGQEVQARRTKGALLAHMRHELRTPLNAIIGYSEMLLEDAKDLGAPTFLADLEKLHAAGRQSLGLVNDILDAKQIEASTADLDLEAYGVAVRHELRTPLNAIVGYCEMLLEDAKESARKGFIPDLDKILTAARRFLALIEDLVNVTKIEAGKMDLDLTAVGPSTMIQDVVRTIRPLAEAQAIPGAGEGGCLLVVDDNETNRDLLSRSLTRQGHVVAVAEDGRQALQILELQQFDLVLLDVVMPGMNGYQVLERLKADPTLRHIPVIMISALDELDSVVRCIERGAEDYLPKPFDPVLLRARIGACLEKKRLHDREVIYLKQIEDARKRSDELLHVILPQQIVEELKATDAVRPRRYENVAVLFCDIVGFTSYCDKHAPEEVVAYLQELVDAYEDLALRHDLQKIKTIGDCFMATAGLLTPLPNPVLSAVECGLEMLSTVQRMPARWNVRVGIHAGPLMAGVVGHRQYLFDVFGDTVNTAARVESNGVPGAVAVSGAAWRQIADRCRGRSLGLVPMKGKGDVEVFRVDGLIGS